MSEPANSAASVVAATRKLPNARDVARGVEYWFGIGSDVDWAGEMWQLGYEKAFCQYETRPKRSPHDLRNLLRKPPLVFTDSEGREIGRIIRGGRFPPTFHIIEPDPNPTGTSAGPTGVVGTIRLITPLRNKYSIQLHPGPLWESLHLTFHMPLFTIYFRGWTTDGRSLWVRLWKSKRSWLLLREPELNHPYLLPALAFIHREWWCFS
jgi:hypothetical protein